MASLTIARSVEGGLRGASSRGSESSAILDVGRGDGGRRGEEPARRSRENAGRSLDAERCRWLDV